MGLIKKLNDYLIDHDYKVIISNNHIYIRNYLEIKDFSSSKIVVSYKDGENIFLGKDLVVSKMQDDEVLINGKVSSIEYK